MVLPDDEVACVKSVLWLQYRHIVHYHLSIYVCIFEFKHIGNGYEAGPIKKEKKKE